MAKQIKNHFVDSTTPLSLSDQVTHNLKMRSNSFYGAVFNALDDYFRKGYAYGLSPDDFSTHHEIKDHEFLFIINPTWKNDSPTEDPNDVIRHFFNDIYNIADLEEMEHIKGYVHLDPETGLPKEYVLSVRDDYELMQILEKILKPYDFEQGLLPTIRHAGVTASSPLCFSMFAQYSLQHIRTMYLNLQGRGWEGHGLHLNH